MVEAIAMATGRNLLDEEVKERVRVWYHNGEDNMLELQRRVGGICQHYEIPMEESRGRVFHDLRERGAAAGGGDLEPSSASNRDPAA
jgi:RecA-family ATPase